MLLDTREREREAVANRVAQPAPRPAQEARAHNPINFFGGGLFQPPVPEPPRREPPRPVANLFEGFLGRGAGLLQPPAPEPPRREPPRPDPDLIDWGVNFDGDFDWIDDPSAYCSIFDDVYDPHLIPTNQVLRASSIHSPAR